MPDVNPGAGFARAGLSAMPAFEDAPELYRPAPAPDDPLARQDARRDEDFALRAAAQATALTRALSGAPPEGEPDGFAARQLARFDEESAALLDGAPSSRAEEAARAAIGRARGRFADWALPQEAAAQTVARRQTLVDTLAQFRAAAEQRPDDADALHAEGTAAIAGAANWLGDESTKKLSVEWTNELYSSATKSWINADPDDAVSQLSAGTYATLPESMRQELLNQARQSAASKVLENARLHENALRDAEVNTAKEQEAFASNFLNAISNGTTSREALNEAIAQKHISPFRARFLADELEAKDQVIKERQDGIRRVMSYIDGEGAQQPSADDVQAHFENVLEPILDGKSAWAKGEMLSSYQRKLGSLPESAELDIRRQLYHADPRQQAEAAELVASLQYNKGDVLFLPVSDLDYAERLRAFVMEGYAPDVAVKFAEEGKEEGAPHSVNLIHDSDQVVDSNIDEAAAEPLVSLFEDLPPPEIITSEEAIELARLLAEILPGTGQVLSVYEASTATYAAALALSRGDFRDALSEGGAAAFALLGAINPAGGAIRKAATVRKTAVLLTKIAGHIADTRVFKAATEDTLKQLGHKLDEATKAFRKELPGTTLRSQALSKMRGVQIRVNWTSGKSYQDQINDELVKYGLKKIPGVKKKKTVFDGHYVDDAGNTTMVEIKLKDAPWSVEQQTNQLQHLIDNPDESLIFIREGKPIEIFSSQDGSAQRALETLRSQFQ